MDEETMRGGELSEEQLGEISGGCAECQRDMRKVIALQRSAQRLLSESDEAVGRRVGALKGAASTKLRAAQGYLNRIAARGHIPAVPDLNLPAPTKAGEAGRRGDAGCPGDRAPCRPGDQRVGAGG